MSVDSLAALVKSRCGSTYFGTVMSTGFYGITCMQTFLYYVHYRRDPLRTKNFVAALWALDTAHEALIVAGAYKFIMASLVNPSSVLGGISELLFQLIVSALVKVATQGFFVYRIYRFNEKNIVGPLIWIPLAIYQLVSMTFYVMKALYSADSVFATGLLLFEKPIYMDLASSSLSVGVTVDVMIAVVLTLLLVRKRTNTEFSSTAHILQRITVFAVSAGIWTAMFALLSLIFLYVRPLKFLNGVFSFSLCSIYCNTVLANLNARAYIRGDTAVHNIDMGLSASSTSQAFDTTGGDKHREGPRVVTFCTLGELSPPAGSTVR